MTHSMRLRFPTLNK
ncbi:MULTISPECIES: erythromycin resistance leader peptide [Bacillaceae]